jgi:hypothetical protein
MTIQPWTPTKTDWQPNDVQDYSDMNRLEKNLLHLKKQPCDDFELSGKMDIDTYTSAETIPFWRVVKILPPRSSLYLKEASKGFPQGGGNIRYILLELTSAKSSPSNADLVWHTAPDINPLVRWISIKNSFQFIENYYYPESGLKLVTNPLTVNALLLFTAKSLAPSATLNSSEDTITMLFHIGYNDI